MTNRYSLLGYFDNAEIKGNTIKEPGFSEKY